MRALNIQKCTRIIFPSNEMYIRLYVHKSSKTKTSTIPYLFKQNSFVGYIRVLIYSIIYISNILRMSYIHNISFLYYCYHYEYIECIILGDDIKKVLLFVLGWSLVKAPSLADAIRLMKGKIIVKVIGLGQQNWTKIQVNTWQIGFFILFI